MCMYSKPLQVIDYDCREAGPLQPTAASMENQLYRTLNPSQTHSRS